MILFQKKRYITIDRLTHFAIILRHLRVRMKYRGVEQLEARRAHNPEVVGSSPASATITDTVNDTIVSFTVSFFIPTFTLK